MVLFQMLLIVPCMLTSLSIIEASAICNGCFNGGISRVRREDTSTSFGFTNVNLKLKKKNMRIQTDTKQVNIILDRI